MKKKYPFACLCLVSLFVFASCATGPIVKETPPGSMTKHFPGAVSSNIPSMEAVSPTLASMDLPIHAPVQTALLPERPPRPSIPHNIMGMGLIPPEDMAFFLLEVNPDADRAFVEELAGIYAEEAAIEGINHDVAFAQMCLETGYLRFGNLVEPEQNNFAGLGATGPGQPGLRFPDARIGVRAQIQHLKAYATDAELNQELVNPRFFLVRRGSAPTIKGLAGTWAVDRLYADKINTILERMYFYSFEK